MPKISQDESVARRQYALEQWRKNPVMAVPRMNNLIYKKFAGRMNHQQLYAMRRELWTELGINDDGLKKIAKTKKTTKVKAKPAPKVKAAPTPEPKAKSKPEPKVKLKAKPAPKHTPKHTPAPQVSLRAERKQALPARAAEPSAPYTNGSAEEPIVIALRNKDDGPWLSRIVDRLAERKKVDVRVELTDNFALLT